MKQSCQLFKLAGNMSAVDIRNLQLKMNISTYIGEVNNKVISQGL